MAATILAAALLPTTVARGQERPYAPLDQPGPRLSVPQAKLRRALRCTGSLDAEKRPVILIHGTNLTPKANFSWNYARAFRMDRRPYCTVALPHWGMDDIQVSAEYVVYALREVASRAERQVDVLGFSQGGMIPRWALRFWPDTRSLVDDLVGLAPSNHGTHTAIPGCTSSCVPSYQQQRSDSNFTEALNSRTETFKGIDYTNVYTRTDWVVTPNFDESGSSSLRTGDGAITNVAIQDICPNDPSEHLAVGSYDAVGYALAVDALDHNGPAAPERVPITTCGQAFMPGVREESFAQDYANYFQVVAEAAGYPATDKEPPLKPYVFAR